MCDDDDWDTPSNPASTFQEPRTGVASEGGCRFSSGRGFAPVAQNDGWGDSADSWGNSNDTGFKSKDSGGGDDGWGGSANGFSWEDSGAFDRKPSGRGARSGFRGGRGGGRGSGRGGGGFRNFDDDDDGGRPSRGERGSGRGGRGGGGRGRGDRNGDFGDTKNGEGAEPERKREHYVPPETESAEDLFTSGISSGVNFLKLDDIEVNVTGNDPPRPITSFETSGLRPLILENVQKSGYTKPTPIQKYSIPAILNGRDLMSCAQTGSGKTAAFMLPIIHDLITNKNPPKVDNNCAHPNVVIISPTRELAIQIAEQGKKFAYNSTVKVVVVYGGTSTNHQRLKVQGGAHILVATPGRLKDFVNRNTVSFSAVQYFVLDEADRMLDMGFLGDVEEMLSHQSMPATGERQTLMFSATFPEEIQQLASRFLHNYIFLAVGIVGSASTDVEQKFYQVGKFEKRSKLLSILEQNPNERTLIFVETKRNADFLATFLSEQNIQSTSIHGDRYQSEREQALRDFKTGTRKVLVATGVAARGLDIKGVQHVINYDLPNSIDEYVHRIGRTGRVGNYGRATSFFDEDHDRNLAGALAKILSQAKQEIPDWLGSYSHGGSGDQFGGRDIRGDSFGRGQDLGAAAVEEEEMW